METKINPIEKLIQQEHTIKQDYVFNIHQKLDERHEKYFVTFPYPYTNGKLHLGHFYTLISAEIQALFNKMLGKNVLFPFAFHATGMPIVACAAKLENELATISVENFTNLSHNSQIKILLDMDVSVEDINKFKEPIHWVKYFKEKNIEDLKQACVHIDFNRTFYTTSHNPYYDSFVTWQFTHLMKKNYVIKGKRYVIYSKFDDQPCADHDRSTGEGIEPIEYVTKVLEINGENLIVTVCGDNQDIFVTNDNFIKFKINDTIYIANKRAFNNIRCQYENVEFIEDFDVSTLNLKKIPIESDFGTGFYLSKPSKIEQKNIQTNLKYYEPASQVISRSGDICVVAYTDQWFINYADPKLKSKVKEYVDNHFSTPNEEVLKQLKIAVDWLVERPCSRKYGLGTFIPGTTDLIDSLSDSTIYMAYYTIAHLIETIPIEYVDNDMWNFIFLNKEFKSINNEIYDECIKEMKREFKYWYPVDLRVSGKDLIPNHLTMSLFNHYAIWEDFDMMPKSYMVNGYLTIDGNKMSKSEGTFITMSDALKRFGTSVTRYILCMNEGIQDGNFESRFVPSVAEKLLDEQEFIFNCAKKDNKESKFNIWDHVFGYEMEQIIREAKESYINANYKNVITLFDKLRNSKNKYLKNIFRCNMEQNNVLIYTYCVKLMMLIYPICPHWVISIIDKTFVFDLTEWKCNIDLQYNIIDPKYSYYSQIISDIVYKCNNVEMMFRKKGIATPKITVTIYKNFSEQEKQIINNYPYETVPKEKQLIGKYKHFTKSVVEKQIQKYGVSWIEWINNSQDEYTIITDFVDKLLPTDLLIPLSITYEHKESNNGEEFKFGPGLPKVDYK